MAMPLPLTCTIRSGRRLRIVSTSLSTMSAATAGIRPGTAERIISRRSSATANASYGRSMARYGAKTADRRAAFHIGVGSAAASTTGGRGGRRRGFAALVLLDVPVCPPGRNRGTIMWKIGEAMAERARRRKIRFDSREDFVVSASRFAPVSSASGRPR